MKGARSAVFVALALLCAAMSAGPMAGATPSMARASGDGCGPGLVAVGNGMCSHGGDRVPDALDEAARRVSMRAGTPAKQLCAADGRSGRRIRVLYGFPADTTSRAGTFLSWIRSSVALADANLDAQTPRAAGQHLRMFCKDDRKVTVSAIRLLPIGGDSTFTFGDVIDSLVDRVSLGLGSADLESPRVTYVVFVDNVACCYGPAGQGTIYLDDRADPRVNANNVVAYGPRFAMVEIGGPTLSGAYVFLHETGHTIGAVQLAAPHSSGAGHCYTAADVMCYPDGGPWFQEGGSMETVCAAMPDGQYPFDCDGGDYYDPSPPPGDHLRSHWNTADSGWLTKPP